MKLRHWILVGLLFSLPARADRLNPGDWIGSAGIGFMSSPALFLLSPHLERVYRRNLYLGGLIQAGLGTASLFTATFTARFQVGNHPRLRPTLEGGIGLAAGSAAFASAVGVAIHVGMGVDYLLEPDLAISTIIRANFAPPVQTFFLSWSIFQVRYLF